MLAMIEINLLPPEYRPRETTNVPFMLTLVAGFIVIGGLFLYWMKSEAELQDLTHKREGLERTKADKEQEAKKVDLLKAEIELQKTRQQTIIDIGQSKVMWSQKLEQLSGIMFNFKAFWISNMTLTRPAKGGSLLTIRVSAANSNLTDVARYRDALQNDPNFFYHFARLESFQINRTALQNYKNADEKLDFEVKLPLTDAPLER